MKLTNKLVEHHYRNENFELMYATETQIDKLCSKLDDDLPVSYTHLTLPTSG